MTEYVKSTNFASKDSLPKGNPLKIVKGTEIDTEFNNIATAILTKADANNPVFSGTPQAPTAAFGTSTTQVATTAFVQAALQALHPVGSIYINTTATNPATLFGFGTWVEFGAGRVLVGQNASDAIFDTLEETGGSKDAIVVSHSHSFSAATDTQGNHAHTVGFGFNISPGSTAYILDTLNDYVPSSSTTTGTAGAHSHNVSGTTNSAGSSGTNANVQPYIVVKMWKRTA